MTESLLATGSALAERANLSFFMRVTGGGSTLRSSGIFVVHKVHVERTVLPFPGKYADHKGRQGGGEGGPIKYQPAQHNRRAQE